MLSEELTDKLKYLADSSNIKDEEYLSVLSSVKSIVVANITGNTKAESSQFSSKEVQSALTAVLVLVTESVRQSKGAEIKPFLTQAGFSSERADLLVKLQENIRNTTLVSLNSVQSPIPRVVDANWSLNYIDKDSSSEQVGALEYQLELQTLDSSGTEKPIQFACNLNEMQDLVSKLKEACKHVEKVSSSN